MRPASLTQLLYSVAVSHTECAPSTVTADCVPVARLRTALLRENWTTEELHHVRSCSQCQQQTLRGQELLYHPSLTALMQFVRTAQADADLEFHLERDACYRCQRLLKLLRGESLISRLGTQQLDRALQAAEVLHLPPPGARLENFTLTGERHRALIAVGDKPTIRVEAMCPGPDVVYLAGSGFGEQFVPVFNSANDVGAVSLRVATLPEWGEMLIVSAEPLLLRPESRSLWNRYQTKANVSERRQKRERG